MLCQLVINSILSKDDDVITLGHFCPGDFFVRLWSGFTAKEAVLKKESD